MDLLSFKYRAVNPSGRVVTGYCESASLREARSHLLGESLNVLTLQESRKRSGRKTSSRRVRINSAERGRLTANLHTIVSSAIPLSRGLRLLAEEAENERVSALLHEVKGSVDRGMTFTESLRRHPEVFPPVYCSMVQAGESTGALEDVFLDLKEYLEWQDEQKRFLRKSLLPPCIVICGVFGLILVLMLFVIPSFENLFVQLQLPVPAETKTVFEWSGFVRESGLYVLGGVVCAVLATVLASRRQSFRFAIETVLHRVPVAGKLLEQLAMMRFLRNFHLMMRNGIALAPALHECVGLVSSQKLSRAVRSVEQRIMRGSRLAEAMRSSEAFPNMVVGLVTAGEESGRLAETLRHVYGLFEREVQERFAHLLNLVTPLSTLFLGLVVGGVAVILLNTLFSVYNVVGN